MSWSIHDKEFEAVLQLPASERYAYWIKRVADWEEIWSLSDNGWALSSDDDGNEAVPVWPHSRFAEACARDNWAGFRARIISLSDWLDAWIPGMIKDKRQVAVFPTPHKKSLFVAPERVRDDLREYLAEIGIEEGE